MRETKKPNQKKKMQQTKQNRPQNTSKKSNRKAAAQRKKVVMLCGAAACVGLMVFLGVYFAFRNTVNKVPEDVIYNNIYIETIDVSGMKAAEAKTALEQKIAEYQEMKIHLVAEEVTAEVALSELGFDIKDVDKLVEKAVSYGKDGSVWSRYGKVKALEDEKKIIEATYAVDSDMTATVIADKLPELENAAKDATITRSNGQFVIEDEVKGVAIDPEESAKVIESYFNSTWEQEGGTIELVTTIDEPDVTREQLEQIQDVLGTFTTNCGTGGGRVQNIKTGTKLINGAVIMPGEEYSADAAMRPYTYENGYAEAGSYENGKVVQSMGGGICQVSSTLYNACILAELEITQRQPHSMMVGYVKPSMDAAIAGDYKDLKFKNSTDYPIYLEGYVSGGYITFTIYGKETRPENRTVKFVSETLSTTPAGKKFIASGASIGTMTRTDAGHTGMKAQLWKIVYVDGKEVSREIFNSSNYRASDATYEVGTASSNAEASNIVKNAISSQNESTIKAAIQKAKDTIAAASKPEPTPTPNPEPTPGGDSSGDSGTTGDSSSDTTQ